MLASPRRGITRCTGDLHDLDEERREVAVVADDGDMACSGRREVVDRIDCDGHVGGVLGGETSEALHATHAQRQVGEPVVGPETP